MCPNSPLVKKLVLIIALTILFPIVGWAQYAGHTFRFSANYACAYSPLDSILIENLTQGGTMTLYYPDTVASFVFTGIEAIDPAKRELQVSQNYPNPFSGETNIDVYLPEPDQVLIHVHDLAGRKVSEYISFMDQGTHQFTFYACDQQAYLLTVSSNKHERKQIMIQVGKGDRSVARIVHNQMTSRHLTTMEVQDMPYNTGDELRFTGFVTDMEGQVVNSSYEQTPDNSKDYLFDIANEVPDAPTEIYGETWVHGDATGVVYEITTKAGIEYNWEVPEKWSIGEGQGTHRVMVDAGGQSGDITVRAENACGISPTATLQVKAYYTVTLEADPPEGGTVTPEYAEVEAGSIVTVSAYPAEIWDFQYWSGYEISNERTTEILINQDEKIWAVFSLCYAVDREEANFNLPSYYYQRDYFHKNYKDLNFSWHEPFEAIVIDYNQDGFLDFIYTNSDYDASFRGEEVRNKILFYLSDCQGYLTLDETLSNRFDGTVHGSKGIAGDFNNNGYPDILFSDHGIDNNPFSGSYPILLFNMGDGNFNEHRIEVAIGEWHSVSAGDFNNSGSLDIFLINPRGGASTVLINDGHGNFIKKTDLIPLGITDGGWKFELFDINKDGYLDLIIPRGDQNPYDILYGNGKDFFGEHASLPSVEWFDLVSDMLFYDINQNGNYEIILSRSGKGIIWSVEFGWMIQILELIDGEYFDSTEKFISDYMVYENGSNWIRIADRNADGKINLYSNGVKDTIGPDYEWELINGKFVRINHNMVAPTISTASITDIARESSISGGKVSDYGGTVITHRGVVWSTVENPSIEHNDGVTDDGAGMGSFTSILSGLNPETHYYVRAYACNSVGVGYGQQESFTTLGSSPSVITTMATDITTSNGLLNGKVNPNFSEGFVSFEYGLSEDLGQIAYPDQNPIDGGQEITVSTRIESLYPNTKYYYRISFETPTGVLYGEVKTFTTYYGSATDIEGNTYFSILIGDHEWMAKNLRVTKYSNGDLIRVNPMDHTVVNIHEGLYVVYNHRRGDSDGINSEEEMAEMYGALYNWYAVDDQRGLCPTGWHVPSEKEWMDMINYLMDEYDLHNDGQSINIQGVGNALKSCRQENSPLGINCRTYDHPRWDSDITHYGMDSFGFSALPGGRTDRPLIGSVGYWWSSDEVQVDQAWGFSIYASSGSVLNWPAEKTGGNSVRCIRNGAPSVKTLSLTNVSQNAALSGGNIFNDGGSNVTDRGVVWSNNENPTISNHEGMTQDGSGMGVFISPLTDLIPETSYFVRAYATNSEGTGYGNQISFITPDDLPAPRTKETSRITHESAVLHGIVNPNLSIATISFEYGLTEEFGQSVYAEPNLVEGSLDTKVSAAIYELDADSTYYYRLIAENNNGIAYGETKTFKTFAGSVSDIDGNEYWTTIIGEQEWTTTNLMVTRYNNGDSIQTGLNDSEWITTVNSAIDIYPHSQIEGLDSEREVLSAYGALYNWYAAADERGICPVGWRVPSVNDWQELVGYLMTEYGLHNDWGNQALNGVGNALKSCRQVNAPVEGCNTSVHPRWGQYHIHYGTDNFSFAGLPGGYRTYEGDFGFLGQHAGWWSTTDNNSTGAFTGYTNIGNGNLVISDYQKIEGFSIRCVRDAK